MPTKDKLAVPLNTTKPTQDERLVRGYSTSIENHPHQVKLLICC
jgi:hypothetical protein